MMYLLLCATVLVSVLPLCDGSKSTAVLDHTLANSDNCSLWHIPVTSENGSTTCQCASDLNGIIIHCDEDKITLHTCHTISYDDDKELVAGLSPYACFQLVQVTIPTDIAEDNLNDLVCEHLNRTGLLCGSCKADHSFPPYSYSLECVECLDYKYNWLKYLAVVLIPLTVFYFLVISLRISVTSERLNAYVLIGQILATPRLLRDIWTNFPPTDTKNYILLSLLSTLAGMWNLDFFRFAHPRFCLHPSFLSVHILILDYISAVYPLGLVIITYFFCQYRHRFPVIVRCCGPIYRLFARFRREFDIQKSLINSFATFLLLSYVKVLNITFDLLVYCRIFAKTSHVVRIVLFYDATIEYFGSQHAPYAVFSLIVSMLLNIFPLLLLIFYPSQYFQRCLNYFGIRSLILHTFMDTFQGCYKSRPIDCRYFAAVYLAVRLLNLLLLSSTQETGIYFPLMAIVFISLAVLVCKMQPYRTPVYNTVDTLLFLFVGFSYALEPVFLLAKQFNYPSLQASIWLALGFLACYFFYGISLFVYSLLPKKVFRKLETFSRAFVQKCHLLCKFCGDSNESEAGEEALTQPHLLQGADECTPLI